MDLIRTVAMARRVGITCLALHPCIAGLAFVDDTVATAASTKLGDDARIR
jgi:hypothetical protein